MSLCYSPIITNLTHMDLTHSLTGTPLADIPEASFLPMGTPPAGILPIGIPGGSFPPMGTPPADTPGASLPPMDTPAAGLRMRTLMLYKCNGCTLRQ